MRLSRISRGLWLVLVATLAFPGLGLARETTQLRIGGGTLDIAFDAAPSPALRQGTLTWITRAAQAVTVYYTRFPVGHVDIVIHLQDGRGVGAGRCFGDARPRIEVSLGSASSGDDLSRGDNNWMMTHEMVHLAFSSVEEKHHWIEEGLATYIEPIARVRAGELTAGEVWRDMVEQMPQGQPTAGDRGLDETSTWGRTYWGGAIFCLLADVEIRKQTHNRRGLEHALRGIVKAGGTIDTEWSLDRVLAIGDQSVGVPVLQRLYEQMKASPAPVDLDGLWRQLGVERRGRVVVFHDDAPLADVRKAIMMP